jgi:hypothetical protein
MMFEVTIDVVQELPDGRINVTYTDGYGIVFPTRADFDDWCLGSNLANTLRQSAYQVAAAWYSKHDQVRPVRVDSSCSVNAVLEVLNNV